MKKTIKFLGLVLLAVLFINTSCKKETEKVEEDFGTIFNVATSDGGSWQASAPSGKMEGSAFVLTSTKDGKEVVLTIKEFAKGKYSFSDTLNYATYTPDKSDATKLYKSSTSGDNYIEITNVHSNGTTTDGKFSFLATDENMNVLTISGNWINVPKY